MLAEYEAGRLPTIAGIVAFASDPELTEEVIEEELADAFGIEPDENGTYPLSCKELIPDFIST